MLSKKMVGISEAAKLLGVGVSTLRAWDRSGAFRASRTPGGQRRYRIEAIEQMQGEYQGEEKQYGTATQDRP